MSADLPEYVLVQLQNLAAETEVVEFKEAKNTYDFGKLGKYFSALSNEANLKMKPCGWLVFGIENKRHQIVGTQYRKNRKDLDSLKGELANRTTNRITFIEIHELQQPEGRVLMFQIPAAPKGMPIAFDGHYYGRDGEELAPLNIEEIERIRSQGIREDWSAVIVPDAGIEDLDETAIRVARENFKNKFPGKEEEVNGWNDVTFLNKAKITKKGKITRAAIVLLGKEESEHFVSPAEVKIRWLLRDALGNDKDYLIVSCPMLLAVEIVYRKIRNLKYRYIRNATLFPEEVDQYEPYAIRETINNQIAHQDYSLGGRMNVVEMDDQLVFTNLGSFIPGNVETVVSEDAPEESYRNPFLANAMFNLGMVDTAGGGIRKIFHFQRQRFFPMPDYDLSNGRVKVTITGKIINLEYTKLLAQHPELTLEEIMALDKVQKKKVLTSTEEKRLKQKKLIEGRRPNYYLAKEVAQKAGQKAAYSKQRGFDKRYYLDLITKAISEHGSLSRKDVDELLWKKLPDWMEDQQRKVKINNLLAELRKNEIIQNKGTFKDPEWVLINRDY